MILQSLSDLCLWKASPSGQSTGRTLRPQTRPSSQGCLEQRQQKERLQMSCGRAARALADRDRFPGKDRMGRIPAVCRQSQLRCRYGLGTCFVNCNMGKKCQVFPADQGGWQRGEVGTGCLGRSHGVWSGNTDAWGAGNPPLDLYLILMAIKGFGTGSDGT